MTLRIIGLSGKKRSGKNTVYLLAKGAFDEDEGGQVIKVSFADALKDMARKEYHWNGLKDVAGRVLLQQLGVHYRETVDENFWVTKWVEQVTAARRAGLAQMVFACDVRFPNEVEAIRAMGGEVWRVERPGNPHINDTHVSETALDDYRRWDAVLCNDSLDHLRQQVMNLLTQGEVEK